MPAQRARERSEPLPKLCEGCKAVVPRTARECPCCGSPIHARTEVESGRWRAYRVGLASQWRSRPLRTRPHSSASSRGYATLRGYNDGWASHKYRERFGVWPNDPRVRCARPTPPSLKTKNWIVSRQIAFAKARERVAHG